MIFEKFLLKYLPYQLFFTLGIIYLFLGLSIWPLASFDLIAQPYFLHRHLLIFGGIGSFATGFLITSIPCFTSTKITSFREYNKIFIAHLLFLLLTLIGTQTIIALPVAAIILFSALADFFYRRLMVAKMNVPQLYHLIGIAFLIGIIGSICEICYPIWPELNFLLKLSQTLSYQGVFLLLLLGIGSRLFTSILGLKLTPKQEKLTLSGIGIYFSSFILEAFITSIELFTLTLRFLILTFILTSIWKLYKSPKTKTWESRWVWYYWICVWLGHLFSCLFLNVKTYSHHALYIGAFLGLTLVVASRIILAHGGYLMENIRPTVKFLNLSLSLILMSLILRCIGFFFINPSIFITTANYLSLGALIIWSWHMTPRIFHKNSPLVKMREASFANRNTNVTITDGQF